MAHLAATGLTLLPPPYPYPYPTFYCSLSSPPLPPRPPNHGAHNPTAPARSENVVIVGAGIAGLATSLALHRLGIKSLVLEQSDSPRTTGSCIAVWENAWRALEALGVAEGLRKKFVKLTGAELYSSDGSVLKRFPFQIKSREVEVRGVYRKILLEALAEPLPPGTLCFNAPVTAIHRNHQGGHTSVELKDGSIVQTKVLVGCDGLRSVVGNWMGFKEPRYVGYVGIRGVGEFPNGHNQKTVLTQILGEGVRAGLVPMDSTSLYWFIAFNSPSGSRITDPELIRKEAQNLVQGWPTLILEAIEKSPPETLTRSALRDRWLWPFGSPKMFIGGVTLAGDAFHPMTPNLAQGGCCALEDAVILGRELAKAMFHSVGGKNLEYENLIMPQEMKYIEHALETYANERRSRVFPLSIQSFVIGALLQWDLKFICTVRNRVLPIVLQTERLLGHTSYDCGLLTASDEK